MSGISKKYIDKSAIDRLANMGPVIDMMETLYKFDIVGEHEIVINNDKLIIYWVEYKDGRIYEQVRSGIFNR